ncbi:MAG: hypothetical protein AAB899_02245 [Patescibacteria group bacterium]
MQIVFDIPQVWEGEIQPEYKRIVESGCKNMSETLRLSNITCTECMVTFFRKDSGVLIPCISVSCVKENGDGFAYASGIPFTRSAFKSRPNEIDIASHLSTSIAIEAQK